MALSSLYSDRPIGTLEELAELKLNPQRVGSCSPQEGNNIGCAWYARCPIKDFRDRKDGKMGPEKIAVLTVLTPSENSVPQTTEMNCFEYFWSGAANRARQAAVERSEGNEAEIIKIVSVAGDKKMIQTRESVRIHEKKDPNCPLCQKNECNKTKQVLTKPHEVEKFLRPKEAFPELAMATEMMDETTGNVLDVDAIMNRVASNG